MRRRMSERYAWCQDQRSNIRPIQFAKILCFQPGGFRLSDSFVVIILGDNVSGALLQSACG